MMKQNITLRIDIECHSELKAQQIQEVQMKKNWHFGWDVRRRNADISSNTLFAHTVGIGGLRSPNLLIRSVDFAPLASI